MADCYICLREFTSEGPTIPYVLGCGHSICASCSVNDSLKNCPTCRKLIDPELVTKNYSLIQSLTLDGKTVCTECQSQIKQKERIRICLPCSAKKETDWIKKPDAEKRYSNFYLCGFCVVESHLAVGHCVKKISELQNFVAAAGCRDFLAIYFGSSYKEIQYLLKEENETILSFTQAISLAISALEIKGANDPKVITSEMITDAIRKANSDLDEIVHVHSYARKEIEKTTAKVMGWLQLSSRKRKRGMPRLVNIKQELMMTSGSSEDEEEVQM